LQYSSRQIWRQAAGAEAAAALALAAAAARNGLLWLFDAGEHAWHEYDNELQVNSHDDTEEISRF
jgi:hypothetical protein